MTRESALVGHCFSSRQWPVVISNSLYGIRTMTCVDLARSTTPSLRTRLAILAVPLPQFNPSTLSLPTTILDHLREDFPHAVDRNDTR